MAAGNELWGSAGRHQPGWTRGWTDREELPWGERGAGEVRRVMGTRGTCPCSPLPPEDPGSPGADLLPAGAALAHPSCPLRVVGRELLPTRPWAGAAPTAILSTWLTEALVTSGHQDRGTSLTPSTLRRQPGRGQRGKTQGFTPSSGAAVVEAVPAFSSSSSSTPSSPSGGHTPLEFRVQRWHGLAGCQGTARHGTAPGLWPGAGL